MAAAIIGDINNQAKLEKAAIACFDNLLDSRHSPVPLSSFPGHLSWTTADVRAYVHGRPGSVDNFITSRPYLWKVRASTDPKAGTILMVEKIPSLVRSMIHYILDYVQRKTEQTGIGTILNNISSMISEKFPTTRQKLVSPGLHGFQEYLLDYPALFEMIPYDAETTVIHDVLFKNRAVVNDSAIILPDGTNPAQNTSRLEGTGTVMEIFATYGFIRDDRTKQDAYFTFIRDMPPGTDLRTRVSKGQRFTFEAYISMDYELKKTTNKWSIIKMKPVVTVGVNPPAPTSNLAMSTASNSEVSIPAAVAMKSCIPKPKDLRECETASSASGRSSVDILGIGASANGSRYQSPSPVRRPDQGNFLDQYANMMDNYHKNFGMPSIPTVPKAGPTAALRAKLAKKLMEQEREMETSYSGNPLGTAAVPNTTAPAASNSIRPQVKKAVKKHDASTQTEFNDEREILLNLLRRSPQLLKLVKAMKGTEY